jgi:broad specificity phosphatase PhoE
VVDKLSKLILIRHSLPQIDPETPSYRWRLSGEGRRRCGDLAGYLLPYALTKIITSTEPKAIETGEFVARELGISWKKATGLHEHERVNVPYTSSNRFEESVQNFFDNPDQLVFGEETAEQAGKRFEDAVQEQLDRYPDENLAIVAHGTVISLFVQSVAKIDAYPIWRQLGLPAFVVFSWPDFELLSVVGEVVEGK